MKKLATIQIIIFLALPVLLFAQTVQDEFNNSKLVIPPKIVYEQSNINVTPPELSFLYEELKSARKIGDKEYTNQILQQIYKLLGREYNTQVYEDIEPQEKEFFIEDNKDDFIQFDFGNDINITNMNSDQRAPSMDVANNGDIYLAYENYNLISPFTYPYITIKKSTDNGFSWSTITNFYSSSEALLFPDIEIGEGGGEDWIFVVYHKEDSKDARLYKRPLAGGSGSFRLIDSNDAVRVRLALDDDVWPNEYWLYVSYINDDIIYDDVKFRRSVDFGETWPDSICVDLSGNQYDNNDIAFGNDDEIYIVSLNDNKGEADVVVIKSTNFGITWGDPVIISQNDKAAFPRIAASHSNNSVVVLYEYWYSSTDRDIYYSYSTNEGTSWTIHNYLDNSTDEERFPSICAEHSSTSSDFHACWFDDGNINYTFTDYISDGWESQCQVNDQSNASDGDFPAISSINNEKLVVWAGTGNALDIYFDKDPSNGIEENSIQIPVQANLLQNYPNPFNPTTTLEYQIPKSSFVTLKIYDVMGKEVVTLVKGKKSPGTYSTTFDASHLSSGAYFYRIEAGSFVDTKRMLLIK